MVSTTNGIIGLNDIDNKARNETVVVVRILRLWIQKRKHEDGLEMILIDNAVTLY